MMPLVPSNEKTTLSISNVWCRSKVHKFRSNRKFITQIIKKYYLFLSFFDDQKYHIDYDLNAKKEILEAEEMSSRRGNRVSKLYCLNSDNKETDISEENSSFLTLLLYIAPVKVKYMCKFALLEMYIFIVIIICNVNWSLPKCQKLLIGPLDKYKIRISYIYSQLNPK